MASTSSDSVYITLLEAKEMVEKKVNLFALVAEIGMGRPSEGTDYVLTLKLVDQSHPAPRISINFFVENATELPHVNSNGDLISLHRVVMRIHNEELYCVFNKKFSSFALFNGKAAVGFSPYQTSSNYHATDRDDEFLMQLRTWSLHHDFAGLTENLLLLRNIKTDRDFDLVCKVLHACKTSDGEWMLFVWDGTDSPPVTFKMDLDIAGETLFPLHPELLPLPREVLCAFPHVGTVLRVVASKKPKLITHLEGGGIWVKIYSMSCELQSGLWKGVLQPCNKLYMLADEDDTVKNQMRVCNDRITSEFGCHPLSSYPWPSQITELDYELNHEPYTTLMDSLTHPEVPHLCKCIVRVVDSYPWQAEEFRSPADGSYRVKLTLEDPTERIHAYICKIDGEKFFKHCPTSEVLTAKMNKLLGMVDGNSAYRYPPWVWCCLKSYYQDKRNPLGSRRYRIFGTTLIG